MGPVAVTWAINPPQNGSISPAGVTAQQLVTVTATLKNDATKSISTDAGLFPPVTVAVSHGGPVPLTASTGLYTTPATIKNLTTATVTATSIADPTKTGTATITLQP